MRVNLNIIVAADFPELIPHTGTAEKSKLQWLAYMLHPAEDGSPRTTTHACIWTVEALSL